VPVTWAFRASLLAVRLAGVYPNEEVERAVNEALADPRFDTATRLLMDGRESQTPISGADVAWRVEFLSSLPDRGLFPRVAYLLRPDQRGLLDLFQLTFRAPEDRTAVEVRVFTTEDEALAWLGLCPTRA
jgi:hypothetical protein